MDCDSFLEHFSYRLLIGIATIGKTRVTTNFSWSLYQCKGNNILIPNKTMDAISLI